MYVHVKFGNEEYDQEIKPLIEKVKDAVKTRNVDNVKTAMEDLNKAWSPIAMEMYKQANPDAGAAQSMSDLFGAAGNPQNPFAK